MIKMELDGSKAWVFWEMSLKVDLSSLSYCVRWSWSSGGVAKHRARVSGRVQEECGVGWGWGRVRIQFSYKNDQSFLVPHRIPNPQVHHLYSSRNLKD